MRFKNYRIFATQAMCIYPITRIEFKLYIILATDALLQFQSNTLLAADKRTTLAQST